MAATSQTSGRQPHSANMAHDSGIPKHTPPSTSWRFTKCVSRKGGARRASARRCARRGRRGAGSRRAMPAAPGCTRATRLAGPARARPRAWPAGSSRARRGRRPAPARPARRRRRRSGPLCRPWLSFLQVPQKWRLQTINQHPHNVLPCTAQAALPARARCASTCLA